MVGNGITFAQVSRIFNQTTSADLEHFTIFLLSSDQTIPKDLLDNHRARRIQINCAKNSQRHFLLSIDSEAFRSSKNTTVSLDLNYCDMSQLGFDFLSEFSQLTSITFSNMSNVGLANYTSLPPLLGLTELHITSSTGLNEWKAFPQLSDGLKSLYLQSNEIKNEAMDRILKWAAEYSVETLEHLRIDDNDLTIIPEQVHIFSKLQILRLDNQKHGISEIPSGSFHGTSQHYALYAMNNKIETIQEGAFQGNRGKIIC